MNRLFAALLVVASTGCPDIKTDADEGGKNPPVVEFDPSNRIVPFPNNLLLNPATGLVTLPASCNESATAKGLREGVLNKLDGFGTYQAVMTVTFSEAVKPESLVGNVLLFQRVANGAPVPVDQSMAINVQTALTMTQRFDAMCGNPTAVNQLVIVPQGRLDQKATYVVALKKGIQTEAGAEFTAGFTWSLVRQPENPVTVDADGNVTADNTPLNPHEVEDLATLQGINLLWSAHAGAMKFLADKQISHEDVLLAWEFTTQTVTDPLDPTVTGSPANQAPSVPLQGNQSVLPPNVSAAQFLASRLPANSCEDDGGPLPCNAVSDVLGSGLVARQYQIEKPNPLTAPLCGPAGDMPCGPIPGPWADPRTPDVVKSAVIGTLVLTPQTGVNTGCPTPDTTGCPTLIFQHGLGRASTDVLAIASQFAAAGYNVVSIDAVAHGSRAVRVSNDAARLCDGAKTPGTAPQCFAPFLSPDSANTRDNIRQTVLDQQQLVESLKACGTANCGGLKVDASRIQYIGQSLGGIMGSVTVAIDADIKAAVLNVPGVGWVDILENTQTLAIRCSLVDGLIDAGILTGDKWNPVAGTGLCTTDAWKAQPGYRQFATIGRWILDPADPANFTHKLATRRFMIQQVTDDQVVPNIATMREAALTGLLAQVKAADPSVPNPNSPPGPFVLPSQAVVMDPMTNKYITYSTLPADANTGFPGNAYGHGSLLSPATSNPAAAGQLGTAKMQIDAIFFLNANK